MRAVGVDEDDNIGGRVLKGLRIACPFPRPPWTTTRAPCASATLRVASVECPSMTSTSP